MKAISVDQLNEYFIDTLERCCLETLKNDDITIEGDIMEEFNTGVYSFLYDDSLKRLYDSGAVDLEMLQLSQQLRKKALEIPDDKWSLEYIRNSEEWMAVILLSDMILKLKREFDNSRYRDVP